MFDWNDLRHFLAVARHGSTLAAARALGVSQSTVHRRLEELEKRLGRPLVSRAPSGYRLTEFGADMLAYATRVEEAVLALERRLAATNTAPTGTIRVTCPEAVGVRLMRSTLPAAFNTRFPGLRVEFVMSDKLLNLAKGEADIAIRATVPEDDSLFGRKIADVPWAIYGSLDYVARHGAVEDVAQIGAHAVVLFDVELKQHSTNRWFQSVAPQARVAARCNSISALVSAVKSGVGLAALPVIIGDKEDDLVRQLGPLAELTTTFYLLMHQDMKQTPRVRTFFDFMIDELSEVRGILSGTAEPRARMSTPDDAAGGRNS